MKNIIFSFFVFFYFSNNFGQNIYEYERKIKNDSIYGFEEIEFLNSVENIKISGTLISPRSDYQKIVIIVPGSGKDTRHSHPKLTEFLLKNDIAVYRFDERGVGKSEGEYSTKVTPLITDLKFCVDYFKEHESYTDKKIGVLGHSLGGLASLGIVEQTQSYDFLILMSTPVNPGESFKNQVSKLDFFKNKPVSIEQSEKIIDTFNLIIQSNNSYSKIRKECEKARKKLKYPKFIYRAYLSPQIVDIVKLDTESIYVNIMVPTLYIIGEDDELINSKIASDKIQTFKNKFIEIIVVKGMGHYLTLNSGKWQSSKKSEDREINDLSGLIIIDWIKNSF